MSTYVRWRLIIDVCKPRSFWSPSTWNPVAYWCFVEFSSVRFVMKPSGLYGQPGKKKKRTQFHLYVTVTLCNIHHRPFFRPYSMSTGAGFSFVFWLLLIAAKDFGTSKKKNLTPFQKTWIPPRPPISLKLLGKLCKEEEAAVELCMQQNCTKEWRWVHNNAHFLSARHSHTQQRLNPQWGWTVLGIWHNTK